MNKHVTKYWVKYYVENGLCVLCGNHGTIPNNGIKSPAGYLASEKTFHYCICPNGQILCEQNKNKSVVK